MAFPVFVDGDVLNASDMNAVGLWKIGGATFTTVTGFNLPNGSFSANYDNYKLIVVLTAVATDADFTGRMRAAGTNNTSSNYENVLQGLTNGGVASNVTADAQTSFNLGESDTGIVEYHLELDIESPHEARTTTISASMGFVVKAGNALISRRGILHHRVATSYDSFAFISTQNVSGEYWLYGYRNN